MLPNIVPVLKCKFSSGKFALNFHGKSAAIELSTLAQELTICPDFFGVVSEASGNSTSRSLENRTTKTYKRRQNKYVALYVASVDIQLVLYYTFRYTFLSVKQPLLESLYCVACRQHGPVCSGGKLGATIIID